MTEISKITAAGGPTVAPFEEEQEGPTVTQAPGGGTGAVQIVQNTNPDTNKGVVVESSGNAGGNDEHRPSFMLAQDTEATMKGLNAQHTLFAQQRASGITHDLRLLYYEKRRLNPEAVDALEFPEFPTTENPGWWTRTFRQGMLSVVYMNKLDNYDRECKDMLYAVGQRTIVDAVRAVGDKVDEVKNITLTDLAADLRMEQEMLFGLNKVYEMLDVGTYNILTAIDNKGDKIVRCIEKSTGNIVDFVRDKSTEIQDLEDEILTKIGIKAADLESAIIQSTVFTNLNIIDEGDRTRKAVRDDGRYTRTIVRNEGQKTRDKVDEESEKILRTIDPFGLRRWYWGI